MIKTSLLASLAAFLALPSLAEDKLIAPYDYEYLKVGDAERAHTAANVETLGKIFSEGILPRNWDRMRELYADNYIQHNPEMEDGKEGVINLFKAIDYSEMVYEQFLTIAEGPYVVAFSKGKFAKNAPLLFVVDINFIREGQSREHWDILMPIESEINEAGRSRFAVEMETIEVSPETREVNKALAAEFINTVLNRKQANRISDFIGETYIQHGAGQDGAQSIREDLKNFPDIEYDIKRIIAENDFVMAHGRVTTGGQDFSRVDLWRVRDGKMVEHWGAMQAVPDEMAHRNGMF